MLFLESIVLTLFELIKRSYGLTDERLSFRALNVWPMFNNVSRFAWLDKSYMEVDWLELVRIESKLRVVSGRRDGRVLVVEHLKKNAMPVFEIVSILLELYLINFFLCHLRLLISIDLNRGSNKSFVDTFLDEVRF